MSTSFARLKNNSSDAQKALQSAILSEDEGTSLELNKSDCCPERQRDKWVVELSKTLNGYRRNGHHLYFISVTYKDALKVPIGKLFEQFYNRLLSYAVHNYHRKRFQKDLPIVFAFPDIPGSKHKKHGNVPRLPPSDTLHHHALFVAPASLAAKFDALCDPNDAKKILRNIHFLKTIDVQPIRPKDGSSNFQSLMHVVDYSSDYYRRIHRNHPHRDQMVCLPKAKSEKPSRIGSRRAPVVPEEAKVPTAVTVSDHQNRSAGYELHIPTHLDRIKKLATEGRL